ncbi:hypothetical protein FKM82_025909, partial [Ascaphus truei]
MLKTLQFAAIVLADEVTQTDSEKILGEGTDITLDCRNTVTTYVLIWYMQKPSGVLRFLLHDESKRKDLDEEFRERFSAHHDAQYKTFPLTITRSKWSDSATYYCALEHTT